MHRCSTPGDCLSHLAKEKPALLDALRERLVEAAATASTTKGRGAVMPERPSVKKWRLLKELGKVSSSPAMEQALAAMADVRTDLAPTTPAAAATVVWQTLQAAGIYVKGCRAFCHGHVGSSNDFGYRQPARSGEPSRAAGIDAKRRGGELMPPEKIVNSRCCAADCTATLTTEGVQAIRDKWFSLPLTERYGYLVELVWDDVHGKPRPICNGRLHQILGVGVDTRSDVGLVARARAQAVVFLVVDEVVALVSVVVAPSRPPGAHHGSYYYIIKTKL